MTKDLESFFAKRPRMREKYAFPGSFKDLAKEIELSIKHRNKDSRLKKKIMEKAKAVLGDKISLQALDDQLTRFPMISTADHFALLNYKLLYSSNLLYCEMARALGLPYVVAPATGSIPLLNNTWPRGFHFKGKKLNFFSERKCRVPVFLFEEKLSIEPGQGLSSLVLNVDQADLSHQEKKFLEFLFFEALDIREAVDRFDTFGEQITFLNFKLWKYFFAIEIRDKIPDLIYPMVNPIIREILTEDIMDPGSRVSEILFDKKTRDIYLRNFNGIHGLWDDRDGFKGTHFFWGISPKKRLVPLQVDNRSNTLSGGGMSIPLEPGALVRALREKQITSSLFMDFFTITFLEGFVALGGFNQLEYLPQMQAAHVKSLRETGQHELAQVFASRITDGLICGMFPFDFDSGIDLLWQYNSTNQRFKGNLERGLPLHRLEYIDNLKVKDMIHSAIETMMDSVGPQA